MTDLRVLHRDEQVLAVDKQPGELVVAGRAPEPGTAGPLWTRVRAIAPEAMPVHRLDRGTSGVLIFALGPAAHRALSASFESRRAEKQYLALAVGDLAAARCELPLALARAGAMRIAAAAEEGAKAARTDLAPLDRFGRFTWLLARPHTGRTHQIRVHLKALGHPLALDDRYGEPGPLLARDLDPGADDPERTVLARTPLHASSIRVPHPSGRGWLSVESPLPADLATCLELLRAARRRFPLGP